ncbi:hypothetical protein [Tautonia sociabilis]|uniref:Alginate export domain-containing protein n=1 Tax=Tautonia sociabilis TaxID=2080755 RepID=A0A432MM83_9BACT|nr:hypothetical protein [Tautonia sociabilis]RUL88359.1 hypothetical protein TsocGM_07490 [Tautonia sociabilis]
MSKSSSRRRRAWALAAALVLAQPTGWSTAQEPIELPPLPPGFEPPASPAIPPPAGSGSVTQFVPGLIPGEPPPPSTDDPDLDPRPNVLGRPIESTPFGLLGEEPVPPRGPGVLSWPFFPTPGFAGKSGVIPSEVQVVDDFVPVEDRWRIGYPFWDRYDRGNRLDDDYPYDPGNLLDPFNQNVLKGDYPIIGQHTFLEMTASTIGIYEYRELPTATTPFESTSRPFEEQFFGRPNQFFFVQNFFLTANLFHGDAAFKPADWRIQLTPVFNINNLNLMELANVNPNVLAGTQRTRTDWTLQEWFVETKLGDLSPYYDFMSLRVGSQPFISDFRGFLFFDINSGVRLFGNADSNRTQFNLVYFHQQEKNINSFLNQAFNFRNQNLFFANLFRQDFIVPGYTALFNVAYNNDNGGIEFDQNHFLARPDPIGIFRPHAVNVAYLGLGGEGHFGRYNLSHQFYWALGRDTNNPIANRAQTINAQFYAIEGSYDRDWARFKISFLWQSGDANPNDTHATGFDTILDNPVFAGGQFSFYQRQFIPLFGVFLTQRNSFVNDLRSSKVKGQANFVNPGLLLGNLGVDLDLTPKLKMFNNANLLYFDHTAVLEQYLFDGHIHDFIGADLSIGFEYRPLVSENIVFLAGAATLIPGQGFRDLYNNTYDRVDPFVQAFGTLVLTY